MRSGPRVVIAGTGVVGASIAWHLVQRGATDVVLVDRASRAGLGSTGAATGGFRAQFASAVNVRLSLLARGKLLRFRDEVGADPGYRPTGYLWLAGNDAELAALEAARAVQRAEGLDEAVAVGPDDVARRVPWVAPGGILGGVFCPTDGYLSPVAILEGYLAASLRAGARVRWGEEVVGLDRDLSGRVTAVRTTRASVPCEVVVNAAGAWAGRIAALAGVSIPVAPLRRQVAMTAPCTLLPPDAPMTIWCADGFHVRPRDGRVLVAFPTPGDPGDPWSVAVDPRWLEAVAERMDARIPSLRSVAIDPPACWAGLYEMSPDRHAILGADPSCPNLVHATGNSGHGVMHAPAIGQLGAEIVLDGKATVLDAAPLRPSRFAEGLANPGELL